MDPYNKMKDVSGVEELNLLVVNEGKDEGLELATLGFSSHMAGVVDRGKSESASLLDITYNLFSGSRVLVEVRSPLISDLPAEIVNPLLSALSRDNGVVVS